jgi:S1-C subfamily serine protease
MNSLRIISILFLLLLLSGCATIFTGSKDKITFNSSPPDADVYINNKHYSKTPCSIEIDRKYIPMEVNITKEGYLDKTIYLSKKFNAVSVLDLFVFTGISLIVDLITANVLRYDQLAYSVNLSRVNKPNSNYYDGEDKGVNKIENELVATGTGFLISKNGFIATNYHVIKDANFIEVFFPSENLYLKYKAVVVAKNTSSDIAVLQIIDTKYENDLIPPYTFDFQYEIGDEVFTIGYPVPSIGSDFKMTKGEINSLSGINNDRTYMQISTALQPGNSGGPLFNKSGNIIGITSAKINDEFFYEKTGSIAQNMNYAVKVDYLKLLTKDVKNLEINDNSSLSLNPELKDKIKILKNYVCLIAVYE